MASGSLQEKNGLYYAVLNLKDSAGKRKQKWIGTGLEVKGNKKKAEKELRRLLLEYEEKKTCYSNNISFSDYMLVWLEEIKHHVETSTWQGYQRVVKNHISSYFNNQGISLVDLEPLHIQQYYNAKIKGGLSPNTVKKHHANIRKALQEALVKNIIPYNAADRIRKLKTTPYYAKFYDKVQILELLKVAEGTSIETVVLLAAFYGLRRSEVLGLKWSSINFNNNTIQILNTVTYMDNLIEKERGKNNSSCRTLPLTPKIREHLKALKRRRSKFQLMLGSEYLRNDYICKYDNGKTISPSYASHAFKALLEKHKLEPIRFHDLRHSCASLLIAEGFDIKKIQEWLGHSSISTTGNIYGNIMFESKVEMGDSLDGLLKINAK